MDELDKDELDKEGPIWRKSSYCNSSACVEVACVTDHVLIRDSKDPDGPTLRFSLAEWREFLLGLRNREFEPS